MLFVKNVVEIDSSGEDMEKIILKDSPIKEEKPKINVQDKVQEVEVEPTQPLPKDWRFTTNHSKDHIIGDVSKGVTTQSKLHDLCGHFAFISHIEPTNILEAEADSYWLLAMQEELNQFKRNQIWHLIFRPHDRLTIGTKWNFRNKLDESGNVIRNKAKLQQEVQKISMFRSLIS